MDVHHFQCRKLFQVFPVYALSVGAYVFAPVCPSARTLIRTAYVRNSYIYKGILTKLSHMVHLNMWMCKKHFYLRSVFTELWPLIDFDYIHNVRNRLRVTPPTPIKRLWLNFHRWKTLFFSCARSKALLSRISF